MTFPFVSRVGRCPGRSLFLAAAATGADGDPSGAEGPSCSATHYCYPNEKKKHVINSWFLIKQSSVITAEVTHFLAKYLNW